MDRARAARDGLYPKRRRKARGRVQGKDGGPRTVDKLAADGYDPVFGARPLKRLLQQQIENPLARRILSGDFAEGDTVAVDVRGKSFEFARQG